MSRNIQSFLQGGNFMSVDDDAESRSSFEFFLLQEIEKTQQQLRDTEKIRGHIIKSRLNVVCSVSTDDEEGADVCAVCQEEQSEKVAVLQCGHKYHIDCIAKWLIIKNFCPLCKAVAFEDS